jgi:hypothetical protein
LRIGFLPQGLFLAVPPIFRFAHPPLLIPWKDIEVNDQVLVPRLSLGCPETATLMLSATMTRKVKEEKLRRH